MTDPGPLGHYIDRVDSLWEQWDLVCADPGGCDEIDQLLRALVWACVVVGLVIFYAALRPWTTDLPRPAGIVVAAAGSTLIVWISIGIVGTSGSVRTAAIITAISLAAVWIGRPGFTERGGAQPDEVTEDASPTSSTR